MPSSSIEFTVSLTGTLVLGLYMMTVAFSGWAIVTYMNFKERMTKKRDLGDGVVEFIACEKLSDDERSSGDEEEEEEESKEETDDAPSTPDEPAALAASDTEKNGL